MKYLIILILLFFIGCFDSNQKITTEKVPGVVITSYQNDYDGEILWISSIRLIKTNEVVTRPMKLNSGDTITVEIYKYVDIE